MGIRQDNIHNFNVLHSISVILHIGYIFHQQHGGNFKDKHTFLSSSHKQKFMHMIDIFFYFYPKIHLLYKQHIESHCNMGTLQDRCISLKMLRKWDFQGKRDIDESFINNVYWLGKISIDLTGREELMKDSINILNSAHSKFGIFHIQYIFHSGCGEDYQGTRIYGCSNHTQKYQDMICKLSLLHPRTVLQYIEHIAPHCN